METKIYFFLFWIGKELKKAAAAAAASKQKKSHQSNNTDTCGVRVSHDRWALNVKLAEARWAQQQARERELEEVKDFLE